jgi:FMN-dependent NADH-azoreductase
MKTLLIINSSPRSNPVSRKLTGQFAARWTAAKPDGRILERDLSAGLSPYLNEPGSKPPIPPSSRTAAQRDLLALSLSDRMIDEVLSAGVIVLGIPMHNFSVPATFKAWIDQIACVGKTFSYSDQGP